jgi:hypothetical protein
VAQEIGHLPSNREALNSSPRTTKKGGKKSDFILSTISDFILGIYFYRE